MYRAVYYMGMIIFVGWVIGILVNFQIYVHTTSLTSFLHPVVDAILFMAVLLLLFFAIVFINRKKADFATIILLTIGILSVVFAMLTV